MATRESQNGNGHMRHWQAMSRPPASALKTIKGGRLQGMTDVNPQWRYQAMTEQFGPCGSGWKYEIDRLWTEPGCDGEVLGFAQVSLRVRMDEGWGEPVIGVGGNHLIVKESKGLRNNDECWKMAITDALSVALKMLGVAADIYAGLWDGSKYVASEPKTTEQARAPKPAQAPAGYDDWLTDMEACVANGEAALKQAWTQSKPEYRRHLTTTASAKWDQMKAAAAKVQGAAA